MPMPTIEEIKKAYAIVDEQRSCIDFNKVAAPIAVMTEDGLTPWSEWTTSLGDKK